MLNGVADKARELGVAGNFYYRFHRALPSRQCLARTVRGKGKLALARTFMSNVSSDYELPRTKKRAWAVLDFSTRVKKSDTPRWISQKAPCTSTETRIMLSRAEWERVKSPHKPAHNRKLGQREAFLPFQDSISYRLEPFKPQICVLLANERVCAQFRSENKNEIPISVLMLGHYAHFLLCFDHTCG